MHLASNINNQSLAFVHGMNVNSPDFGMSFQKQAINWQQLSTGVFPANGAMTAQPGWWMSIPEMSMTGLVSNVYLNWWETLGAALGITLNFNSMPLGQTPPPNCRGGRTFC